MSLHSTKAPTQSKHVYLQEYVTIQCSTRHNDSLRANFTGGKGTCPGILIDWGKCCRIYRRSDHGDMNLGLTGYGCEGRFHLEYTLYNNVSRLDVHLIIFWYNEFANNINPVKKRDGIVAAGVVGTVHVLVVHNNTFSTRYNDTL